MFVAGLGCGGVAPQPGSKTEGVVGNGDGVAYTGSRGELPGGLLMPTRLFVVAPQSGEATEFAVRVAEYVCQVVGGGECVS